MEKMRSEAPLSFGGVKVLSVTDHLAQKTRSLADGTVKDTGLGVSDAMYFVMETGDKVVVRPSGTEPKVKFYFTAVGASQDDAATLLDQMVAQMS